MTDCMACEMDKILHQSGKVAANMVQLIVKAFHIWIVKIVFTIFNFDVIVT